MKKEQLLILVFIITAISACSDSKRSTDSSVSDDSNEMIDDKTESNIHGAYKIDVSQSTVNWVGKKIIGDQHTGQISLSEGKIEFENNEIVSGTFYIDMKSITNTDPMSEEDKAKLEGHLKSNAFFFTEKFPAAAFMITSANRIDPASPSYDIMGDLTLKGITNNISFPATVAAKDNEVVITAQLSFDRSVWNVTFGSKKFFSDLVKDRVIDDLIEIELRLVARQSGAPSN